MTLPDPVRILSEHQGFLRALARRLVAPDDVDDLVQDTWVRTLEHPPRHDASLRHWLRTVARGLVADRRRRGFHRESRERAVARPDTLLAGREDAERAELLQVVLTELLALDELYQDVLLARYFRGRTPAEIAAERGESAGTIRSREHRALAKLRERLDRGRDRETWMGALAGWLGREPGRATPVAGASSRVVGRVAIVAGGLAVTLLGARWLALEPSEATADVAMERQVPVLTSPSAGQVESAGTSPNATPSARAATTVARAPDGAKSSAGSQASIVVASAEVRGRLLFPDALPVAGQSVRLSWYVCEPEDLGSFQELSTSTDEDGVFVFAFDPPEGTLCPSLSIQRPGFQGEAWCWRAENPREGHDLGTITLRLGGAIEGVVVDRDGQAVTGRDLVVFLKSMQEFDPSSERQGGPRPASVDPATGHFRAEDLPEGPMRYVVGPRRGYPEQRSTESGFVVVQVGETSTVEAIWAPPPPRDDIRLEFWPEPIDAVNPDPDRVHIVPPAGRQVASGSTLSYEDLPEGAFTIVVDDPRFLPWSREQVVRGSRVVVDLVGSSLVWLDVRAPGGEAIELYAVEATYRSPMVQAPRVMLHRGDVPLPGGRLNGLVAGNYEITVAAPGLGRRTVVVAGLAAGESRTVVVEFETGATITGRVLCAGAAVPAATVTLLRAAEEADSPTSPLISRGTVTSRPQLARYELQRGSADPSGAFAFEGLPAGFYALYAKVGEIDRATETLAIDAGETRVVDLVLAQGGTLAGTLLGLDPRNELRVRLLPRGGGLQLLDHQGTVVPLSDEGHFRKEGLRAGEYDAYLCLPERARTGSGAHLEWIGISRRREWVAAGRLLGVVMVQDGEEHRLDQDVSALQPGHVTVEVLEDGQPAVQLTVALVPTAMPGIEDSRARTGLDGRAELLAFPGEYRIRVTDPGNSETSEDPAPLQVAPGGAVTRIVERTP